MVSRGLRGKTYNVRFSKTKYETWDICRRKGAYTYLLKVPYKIPPVIVKGLVHHKRLEKFWYPPDYKVKKRRNQPKLDLWPDAKVFGETTAGLWLREVKFHNEGRKGYQQVDWKNSAQPYWMKQEIKEEAIALYNYLIQRERPWRLEFQLPTITIEGVTFTGRTDILDKPLRLEDLKTARFPTGKSKLKHDVQFTIYSSILNLMCAAPGYSEFATEWGAGNHLEQLAQDQLSLIGKVDLKHLWLPTGTKEEGEERKVVELVAPPRERIQLANLIQNIWSIEEDIASGSYPPREGPHCDWCPFLERCNQDSAKGIETRFPVQHDFLPKVKTSRPKSINPDQLKFNWKMPEVEKPKQIQLELL